MNRLASLSLASVLASLAACSSSPTTSSPVPADGGAQDSGTSLPPGATVVTFTLQSTVQPTSETHTCQYVKLPVGNTFVIESSHVYTPGSHHMLLFKTDLTAIPAGLDKPTDCYEATSGIMSHARGLVHGAQTPKGDLKYPDGVALKLASEEVMMLQVHYLNAGDKPLDARADVSLTLTDGTGVTQQAGVLFFYDLFIDVPARVKARAQTRCPIRTDITLLTAQSHFHKRGYDYAAYLDPSDSEAPVTTTPFYTSADWDHPSSLAAPMKIAAGTRLRFNCGYDNTGSDSVYHQGQSAEKDEMCMFTGIYYPDMGLADNLCKTRDMYGAGTTTCLNTLSCVQTCPPDKAPSGSIGAGTADVDPCWQKCLAQSCPRTMPKVLALAACSKSKCATECATPGAACTSCAQANCSAEVGFCLYDPCN